MSGLERQPARFYPVVPDAAWVARLVPLGVKTIQLRMKSNDDKFVRENIRASLDVARASGCQLIVNDDWKAAIDLGAAYVHLGQGDLASADLSAIRKAGMKLGISTHDDAELNTAITAGADYVALGPIYETKLKVMPWAPQGLARITEWKLRIGATPLVAIGGLTVERAAAVLSAGADSLAVVTDIVAHAEPERRVREWLEIT